MSKKSIHRARGSPNGRKPDERLPAGRRFLFTAVLVSLPFLVLALLELGLRTFSYDGDLNLVVRKKLDDREFFVINRNVARRYFAQAGIENPEPQEDAFEIAKPDSTLRVFCLGESTMQGFPYEFCATPPSFLGDRLRTRLPGTRVEVVNVGLSAVGSYVVKDFLNELLDFRPDLFVVYVGHNEFYGAYGPGSAVAVKGGAWLTRLSLGLLRFKTYLLLRDAYSWVMRRVVTEPSARDATLMQEMVGKGQIPYGSPSYREGLEVYAGNINAMISAAHERHVPILFSTVVSNIGDQPPFAGVFAPTTGPGERKRYDDLLSGGDSRMAGGAPGEAIGMYESATALDTGQASGYFRLGKALAAVGRYGEARRALTKAKDLDALRFRATEEFNDTLRSICLRRGVPVSRIDSAFSALSPHGIIGKELILEHLHPNIEGYFQMAKTWTDDIRPLVKPSAGWIDAPPDSDLMKHSAVSSFDREVGRLRVDVLTSRWPFPPRPARTPAAPSDPAQQIVEAYVQHKVGWSEARDALAEYYAGRGEYDSARAQYRAIAHVNWFSFLPWLRIADFYYLDGKLPEAEEAYRRSLAIGENQYAHMKLGVLYNEEDRSAEAAREIEAAFRLEAARAVKFPPHGAALGRYNLGKAYARLGRIADARSQLQRALAIEPGLEAAHDLLGQLQ